MDSTGALISGLSHNKGMLLGGRFLTGFGGGIANNSSKSYLAEITSPTSRGRWMGLLNSFYYVGQILATGISIPFGKRMASGSSWRAPILIQIVWAAINGEFTCSRIHPFLIKHSTDTCSRLCDVPPRIASMAILSGSSRKSCKNPGWISLARWKCQQSYDSARDPGDRGKNLARRCRQEVVRLQETLCDSSQLLSIRALCGYDYLGSGMWLRKHKLTNSFLEMV